MITEVGGQSSFGPHAETRMQKEGCAEPTPPRAQCAPPPAVGYPALGGRSSTAGRAGQSATPVRCPRACGHGIACDREPHSRRERSSGTRSFHGWRPPGRTAAHRAVRRISITHAWRGRPDQCRAGARNDDAMRGELAHEPSGDLEAQPRGEGLGASRGRRPRVPGLAARKTMACPTTVPTLRSR